VEVEWNEAHVTLVKRCGLDKKSGVRGLGYKVQKSGAKRPWGARDQGEGRVLRQPRLSESRPGPASP
jgi:hypothetical protein